MRDVDYLLKGGTWRFKALTPRAMHTFLALLEVPDGSGTIHEAFLHATEDKGPALLQRLRGMGLETEAPVVAPPPPKAPEPPPVHLWTF